jgi:hypothetical protein
VGNGSACYRNKGEGMVCQPVRIALLLGAITAVAVSPARAQDKASPCAPCTRTIQVNECVPETYTKKVITYKRVCKTEEYDTCRWQVTNECRERVSCVTKRIPVTETVTKKVCKTITVNEKRTVMKTAYKNVEETVNRQHLVELGHWECRERQPLLSGLLHNSCSTGCGDTCNTCNNACTRTHRVWVYSPRYECCPVKVCKKVCYQTPVEVCVPVCKHVEEVVNVQVCKYKCVQEQVVHKYSVPVLKKVSCKATRTVSSCVPVESTVTCTRMVNRCVTREVPAPATCNTCNTCSTCDPCSSRWFSFGLFRTNGSCCR